MNKIFTFPFMTIYKTIGPSWGYYVLENQTGYFKGLTNLSKDSLEYLYNEVCTIPYSSRKTEKCNQKNKDIKNLRICILGRLEYLDNPVVKSSEISLVKPPAETVGFALVNEDGNNWVATYPDVKHRPITESDCFKFVRNSECKRCPGSLTDYISGYLLEHSLHRHEDSVTDVKDMFAVHDVSIETYSFASYGKNVSFKFNIGFLNPTFSYLSNYQDDSKDLGKTTVQYFVDDVEIKDPSPFTIELFNHAMKKLKTKLA